MGKVKVVVVRCTATQGEMGNSGGVAGAAKTDAV